MTSNEQLELWCNGKSVHNETDDECCPDFSCCNPDIDTPMETRRKFRDSPWDVRHKMLMMFLGGAFSDKNIYVAGEDSGKA